MKLSNLSLKNIRKSFKDYAIYFFTLILGISIFYVFNALDSQTILLDVTSNTKEIIKLMTNMLSGVSVFVSFILGFLIIYASRFLIKRRNKEFGIYLTLGMSKRKISTILFFETLFIGIISLIVGLFLGVVLSQFMSLIVANMFDANMTKFTFVFSSSACIKTIIYFAIMYLLVMIFNTINISKCKLIDLLYSSKKSEIVKIKNPYLCVIVFIAASVSLAYAYYFVTGGFQNLDTADKIFKPIIIGCVATFFIFWSLSGLILKIVMSIKKLHYKGLNTFVLRQISSKINTTVFSMTIICLMLFITICVLSASLTVKNSMQTNVYELAPADIQITKLVKLSNINDYSEEQLKTLKLNVIDTLKIVNPNINDYFKDSIEISVFATPDLTLNHTLGSMLDSVREKYRFLQYDSQEDIITISDYNKVAKFYGNQELSLNDDEYIVVADFKSMVEVRNIALKNNEKITIFGYNLKPKYSECQDGFIEMSSQHINAGIIIVPDHVVDDDYKTYNMLIANYKATSKDKRLQIEENIMEYLMLSNQQGPKVLTKNTRIDILEASTGLGALVTFIGLYLGIIFMISSTAILALKELSESSDNKERYKMLRRIGTDEKLLNRALFRQIAIFFMFPLIIAIIHSIFGIIFSVKVLEVFGNEQLLPSIVMTAIFLIIIYGGYFLITYMCSKGIIKEKN